MKPESLADRPDLNTVRSTIETNLLAPIHLTTALLPLLKERPHATVMTVSSGLAFIPMAMTATYCATKAAIHSWTQSLRFQLQGTNVQVMELIPPYVQTELMGQRQANDPRAMPLAEFIAEVMGILKTQPDVREICVKRVYPLRFAAEEKKYDEVFNELNRAMSAARS